MASQSSSQVALKRKLVGNNSASKRRLIEKDVLDSLLDGSEDTPSNVVSPSVVKPPRPDAKSRKNVPNTAFTKVIQHHKSQASKEQEVPSESFGDSTLPSGMESPVALQRKPLLRSGKRVPTSPFHQAFENSKVRQGMLVGGNAAANESSTEDSNLPSDIESPEKEVATCPGLRSNKKIMPSTAYNQVLEQQKPNDSSSSNNEEFEDSESLPSNVPSPDVGAVARKDAKFKKRAPSAGFKQVLANLPNSTQELERPQSSSSTRSNSRESGRNSQKHISKVEEHLEKSQQNAQEISQVRRSLRLRQSESESPSTIHVIEETRLSPPKELNQRPIVSSPTEDIEPYLSLSEEDDEAIKIDEYSFVENEQPPPPENSASLSFPDKTGSAEEVNIVEEISPRVNATAEPIANQPKIHRTFANPRVSKSDTSETNELELPSAEDFPPPFASSTQLVKKVTTKATDDDDTEEEKSLTEAATIPAVVGGNQPANTSQKGNTDLSDSMSNSGLPSQLDSPMEMNTRRRPVPPVSSKKRVSMTEFLAVLEQKKDSTYSNEEDTAKERTPLKPQVWIPVPNDDESDSSLELPSSLKSPKKTNQPERPDTASKARLSNTSFTKVLSQTNAAPSKSTPKARTPGPQLSTSLIASSSEELNEISHRVEPNQTRRQSSRISRSKLSSSQFAEDQNDKSSKNDPVIKTPRKSSSRASGAMDKSVEEPSRSKSTEPSLPSSSAINTSRQSGPTSNTRFSSKSPEAFNRTDLATVTKTPSKAASTGVEKTSETTNSLRQSSATSAGTSLPESEANTTGRRSRLELNKRSSTPQAEDVVVPTSTSSQKRQKASLISDTGKTAPNSRDGKKPKPSTSIAAPVSETGILVYLFLLS